MKKNEKGNLVIERCSGLKDSTEKWIFEKDKIKTEKGIFIVFFDAGMFLCKKDDDNEYIETLDCIIDCFNGIKTGTVHDENS